ncbi:DUF6445 family protein [Sphingomonas sp. Leaf412]|uniref:DUF6445 family protein n=1 Tax=Sphingomonas sp. Leaf412 TaxID=1736370 RepID=UPI0009E9E08A|nr:DUF6445 family protein [Sphingomonas sp. Leaf412]
MTARFPLSPTLRATTRIVGRDREPVVTIDGLSRDPAALVDEAAVAAFAPAHGPAGGYPGLRAPAPLDYVGDVVRALTPAIVAAFALPTGARPRHAECSFSLVTLPPHDLVPAQRAPHVDTTDAHQFALLHYLCDARFGGTAFFRHRATGFEAITPDRLAAYDAARAAEPAGQGYATCDHAAFETIGAVDAAFDRLVVYRSRLLHSGVIPDPGALDADPRTGRLTANIFLTLA